MTRKISIVGVQTTLTKDRKHNLDQAVEIMKDALLMHKYVDMVVFPENFIYFPGRKDAEGIEAIPDEFINTFSSYAKSYKTYIIAGTIINRRDGKLYNTSLMFDRNGDMVGSYDKVHLFDALNAADEEKESSLIARGEKLFTYNADFGKIGIVVCYDIRFPEMVRALALQGVKYLFVPAAFYMPRFDHWQLLLQTAALQNSMYVTGVNLYRNMDSSRGFCGRSLIADPWGISIATASDKPGFIQAYVDSDYCDEISGAIGCFCNRVPSIYDV